MERFIYLPLYGGLIAQDPRELFARQGFQGQVLAHLEDEAGACRVQELLKSAAERECELFISVINLGEVLYMVEGRRSLEASQRVLAAVDQFPIELVEVDRPLALSATRLKAGTAIGYADCFVGALAERLSATIVTGDPDFRQIEDAVSVEWLPPDSG